MESAQPPADGEPADAVPGEPPAPTPDAGGAVPAAEAAGADLPEWEPLTPELLEDEAIRGDFVLRWAIVGLAALFGCSQIADARVLVGVRSGEWMFQHGFLPPRLDPFSLAAGERTWVNLSWLFDLCAAGVHALGGPVGLSVFQGLLAAATFLVLSHTCRPGIRTWWGSICAALALLAAYPRFNVLPEAVTLLGVALTLWLLIRAEQPGAAATGLWRLVPLVWLWSQLDGQAFFGWLLLLLYALGSLLSRPAAAPDVPAPATGAHIWGPAAAALLVVGLHPFFQQAWLAPLQTYLVDYPAWRQSYPKPITADLAWYPVWSPIVCTNPDHRLLSALLLMWAALAALLLDRARAPAGHWLLFLGANAAGAATTHDLGVAAIVNCVLATIHGQTWYKQRFGQIYTVVWTEVLFSRGGRALTVLGVFALAWLVVSGRIDGPDGRRTGLGLDRQLQVDLAGFRKVEGAAYDDRAFHFTLRQGDTLIAAGRKSLVDSRVGLFAGKGDADLLAEHDRVRWSLRRNRPDGTSSYDPAVWKPYFDQRRLSHVLPRLSVGATGPDYQTFFDLLSTGEWTITDVSPATIALYRTRSIDPDLVAYVRQHPWNVYVEAFREAPPFDEQPREWVAPPTWTQRLFAQERQRWSAGTLLAHHYLKLGTSLPGMPTPFPAACLTLAIRRAREGVQETPLLADAHRVLGDSYRFLNQLEGAVLNETGLPWSDSLRYHQAAAALQQAARLAPDDPSIQAALADLYQQAGRIDAALAAAKELVRLRPLSADPDDAEMRRRELLLTMEARLNEQVDRLQTEVTRRLDQQQNRLQVAVAAHQAGGLTTAVGVLQDDAIFVEQTPQARQLLTQWLSELGAGQKLDDSAATLAALGPRAGLLQWQEPVASAALGRGDYAQAISQWESLLEESDRRRVEALLYTSPLGTPPIWLGEFAYPTMHVTAVNETLYRQPLQDALVEFRLAAAELERANFLGAKAALQRALARAPDSPLRPLLRVYWFGMTDELLDPEPPQDWIPITPDLFAPEDAASAPAPASAYNQTPEAQGAAGRS